MYFPYFSALLRGMYDKHCFTCNINFIFQHNHISFRYTLFYHLYPLQKIRLLQTFKIGVLSSNTLSLEPIFFCQAIFSNLEIRNNRWLLNPANMVVVKAIRIPTPVHACIILMKRDSFSLSAEVFLLDHG